MSNMLDSYEKFEQTRLAIAQRLANNALETGTGKLEYQVGYYEALADVILMDNPHVTKVSDLVEYYSLKTSELPAQGHSSVKGFGTINHG